MERRNESEQKFRNGKSGPKYMFRGPRIDWGLIRFLPGETLGLHFHEHVEETFLFTAGHGVLTVDGAEYDIGPGDGFRIEPGEKHDIRNVGSEPLDGIFIKHSFLPEDKVSVNA